MNLLFLYGPPAVRKLTVAQELSKMADYPVFHSHLTRDLVQSLYPGNVTDHYDLIGALREDVMKYCACRDASLIFTFVYDGAEDEEMVSGVVCAVSGNGGVLFAELTAPREVLLGRVGNESRKRYNKIHDPDRLESPLGAKLFSSAPYNNVLKVDTSLMAPAQSVGLIVHHFNIV